MDMDQQRPGILIMDNIGMLSRLYKYAFIPASVSKMFLLFQSLMKLVDTMSSAVGLSFTKRHAKKNAGLYNFLKKYSKPEFFPFWKDCTLSLEE